MKPVKTGVTGCGAISDICPIHGTKGFLRLGDANQFGGDAAFMPNDFTHSEWENLEAASPLSENCRGIGAADLARCIRQGGKPFASAEMACHVPDITEKIIESGAGRTVRMTGNSFERPAPFDHWQQLMKE